MSLRTQLLIIDPQNDFCDLPAAWRPLDPLTGQAIAPALPVAGAHADMQRLARFIRLAGDAITDITVTLDSHHHVDIAHPTFWQTGEGEPVTPFTTITARQVRDGESWLKRSTASAFYRVIGRLSRIPIPADTGDFRLLSPRALQALGQLRERHRFMKGLFGWVGFRRIALPYHRHARMVGDSKFGLWKLWNFALEGITSFSTVPLRAATYLGMATAGVAFLFGGWVVLKAALYGDRVAGYPTMMAVILFLGGVQLIALGLIGEYLGRLYEESKQRPLYVVDTWHAPFVADSGVHPIGGEQRDDHGTTAVGRQVP